MSSKTTSEGKKNYVPILAWIAIPTLIITGLIMRIKGNEAISPFVSNPQQAIGDLNSWAMECLDEQKPWFFYPDFLFGPAFAITIWLIYYWFKYKPSRKEALSKAERFNDKVIIPILALAVVGDWLEGIAILNDQKWAEIVSNIKFVLFALGMVIMINSIIKWFMRWFKRTPIIKAFAKSYLSYFYPGLLSILALIVLINSMDQFDSLMIDLADPCNMIIFSIAFLGTIIKVWYMPYYVQFTDAFYEKLMLGEYKDCTPDQQKKKIIINNNNFKNVLDYRGIAWPITSFLKDQINQEVEKKEYIPKEYSSRGLEEEPSQDNLLTKVLKSTKMIEENVDAQLESMRIKRKINKKVRPPLSELDLSQPSSKRNQEIWLNHYFHLFRRYMGLLFIMVFLWLQIMTLGELTFLGSIPSMAIPAILFAFFTWLTWRLESWVNKPDEGEAWSLERKRRIIFRLFAGSSVVFGLLIVATILSQVNDCPPHLVLSSFCLTVFSSAFVFVFFTIFRVPKENIPRPSARARGVDKESEATKYISLDIIQGYVTKVLLIMGAVVAPLLFILLLAVCLGFDLADLHWLNPINFYLITINGIICGITVFNRYSSIYFQRKSYHLNDDANKGLANVIYRYDDKKIQMEKTKTVNTWFTRVFLIGLILFALSRGTNYHHEINYLAKKDVTTTAISFEDYTKDFLARNPDGPIYFVAAEGGGLRAAYWTMMVLNELDTAGVYDRTFLMSGASGGAIGQSVYTFLNHYEGKLHKDSFPAIIDRIGRHNFLSADAAGLFTRGVVAKFLPFEFMKSYPDRHRLMARRYFNIIGGEEAWKEASEKPFYDYWTKGSNPIPLLVINSTRTKDGSRAVVPPFQKEGSPFSPHFEDISHNYNEGSISYSDAMFLTNRFPFVSPSARIEGRGYFVDGGYYENSGLQSILQVLTHIASVAKDTNNLAQSDFQEFLNRDIRVINIRNSSTSFYGDQMDELGINSDMVNHINPNQELGNILGAIANGGTTALPYYYHRLFEDENSRKALSINKYETINLPYRLDSHLKFHNLMGGQIVSTKDTCKWLMNEVDSMNSTIAKTFRNEVPANKNGDPAKILMPPLGRMIPDATADYMKSMIRHPSVEKAINNLKQ